MSRTESEPERFALGASAMRSQTTVSKTAGECPLRGKHIYCNRQRCLCFEEFLRDPRPAQPAPPAPERRSGDHTNIGTAE